MRCKVDGCTGKHLARGFCSKHYQRFTKHGDPNKAVYHRGDEQANIWGRAKKENGCWNWNGYKIKTGYGRVHFRGKRTLAHRAAWELTHGKIPAGKHVLHKCDNPSCINPEHLFLGSHVDNMNDRLLKERTASKLTKRDVILIRSCPGFSHKRWANLLNVSVTAIAQIRRKETWAWV